MILREQVTNQEADHLTIDVVATRGTERREWIQVLTDTPENEENNVVDELYEVDGGKRRKLRSAGRDELFRLYSWTMFQPDGHATDVRSERREVKIGARTLVCNVEMGRNQWNGKAVRFEFAECPDFLWTHGPSRFVDERSGEEIWRQDVIETGNSVGTGAQ